MIEDSKPLYSIQTGFRPIEPWGGQVHRSVMPIVSVENGEFKYLGTGFIIWPGGILVTAKHVIDKALPGFEPRAEIYALYATNEEHPDKELGYIGGLLTIKKISWSLEFDIAYCLLEAMISKIDGQPLLFPSYPVSSTAPKVGENILGFGYHENSFTNTWDSEKDRQIVHYSTKSRSTTGVVVEVFRKRRDSSFLNFPCFQSSARFEPGMSGGPIINEAGYVCGVICSAFSGSGDDGDYLSFCSTLWPSFGYTMKGWFPDKGLGEDVLVYDLIKEGAIKSDESFGSIGIISENGKTSIFRKGT